LSFERTQIKQNKKEMKQKKNKRKRTQNVIARHSILTNILPFGFLDSWILGFLNSGKRDFWILDSGFWALVSENFGFLDLDSGLW
jgi:hypothetical protein